MARRVAIVGSGVSGLVAAHVLAKDCEVTLYEADERLGGHADTHQVDVDGRTVAVDTGFIVHNERTYPTLLRLFAELGVATQESDMSMSVRDEATGLEYAGALGRRGLFPTPRNLMNPRYLRMLVEITRFHRKARRLLAQAGTVAGETTLDQFLTDGRFSDYFRRHFATPLVACVWSCDPAVALEYPARYLFTFLEHHGMLTVFGSPTWRTVSGGSQEYVAKVAAGLDRVLLGTKVTDVLETADGVQVTDGAGHTETYDAVVLAAHPDQALGMLARPTTAQREVLGAFRYSANVAQLHTDTSLLPTNPNARASWNYQRRTADDARVLVTYDMTRLMRLHDAGEHFLVTLNGTDIVRPESVLATREYAHPIYEPAALAAQERLSEIDTDRLAFAGAWQGWGFHEDGARSGVHAAERVGGHWPATAMASETVAQETAPRIYRTTVAHARTAPVRNTFRYAGYCWLVDLDELPEFSGPVAALLRRLARFEARDHIGDPDASIRANIEELLAGHGIDLAGGRIRMLAQARVLGYVFNPISVFWCHRPDGALAAVVAEVHNTYGGRHAYVVQPDARGRACVDKELYVSPFNDTSGEYELAVPAPADRLRLSVTLRRDGQPPFVATLRGQVQPAGTRSLLRAALAVPVAPLLGMARIRWQGIKLWLRRLPVQPRPMEVDDD